MKSKAFIVTGADGDAGQAWAAAHIANGARVALVGRDYPACRRAADATPAQSGARNGVRVPSRIDIVGPGELESAPHPNSII